METDDIPAGFVSVPVKVIYLSRKYACTMLAGSIGIQGIPNYDNNVDMGKEKALSSKGEEFPEPVFTGIRPLTGWMIYEDKLLWKEAWKAIFNWGLLWSWL
jgi:type IV secretory pathway TraG/TraD family ATPase VirD4